MVQPKIKAYIVRKINNFSGSAKKIYKKKSEHNQNHYQKTGEKQRNYRRKYSVGNLYRRT